MLSLDQILETVVDLFKDYIVVLDVFTDLRRPLKNFRVEFLDLGSAVFPELAHVGELSVFFW